ncbi:MAG: hypothetical protein IJO65_02065 [Lachnospiraceae bacterium]|nr:hypothetical protein [Lachnospiraceae bacterium]
MKNKYLKMYLGISVFLILFLGLYIYYPSIFCKKEHFKDVSESRNMVPDEETAEKIADAIVEARGGLKGLREGFFWDTTVDWDEQHNMWSVCYSQRTEGGGWLLDAGAEFWIDRDSGMIVLVYER